MQKIFPDCLVCTHSEREFSLGPREATRTLNHSMSQGVKGDKFPSRRSFGASPLNTRLGKHLQFSGQVMGHHGTEGIYLIPSQFSGGNDIETAISFRITKNSFLGTTTIVELNNSLG